MPSHLLRFAEVFDDERHLAGGEELGVLAEGILLQGCVERTAAAYPACKAVDGHVRGCIGEVHRCKFLLAVTSDFHCMVVFFIIMQIN